MYGVGEFIVHSTKGVCRVEEICTPDFGKGSDRRFYRLCIQGENPVQVYTPIDAKGILLRPVMSACEVNDFISHIPSIAALQVTRDKNRKDAYRRALLEPYPANLISIIKAVYERTEANRGSRKKLPAFETEYSARAKEVLYAEMGIALGMPADSVEDYIVKKIDG